MDQIMSDIWEFEPNHIEIRHAHNIARIESESVSRSAPNTNTHSPESQSDLGEYAGLILTFEDN